MDDCFAALDTQTSKLILSKLFSGNLVKGRTVVLVVSPPLVARASPPPLSSSYIHHPNPQTHHVSLALPIADFLVVMDHGRISSSGPVDQTLPQASEQIVKELAAQEKIETTDAPFKALEEKVALAPGAGDLATPGKLVIAEEKAEGAVSSSVIRLLFRSWGGPWFWLLYFIFDFADCEHTRTPLRFVKYSPR